MRNEAVEMLISEIQESMKYVSFHRLSESAGIDITLLQKVLLTTDTPISDKYFTVDVPLFDLFRTVRIDDFGDIRSIELLSFPVAVQDVSKVESFTNMLYDRLKNKTVGQGKFNNSDQNHFEKGEWLGKLWTDYASTSVITLKQEKGFLIFSIVSSP